MKKGNLKKVADGIKVAGSMAKDTRELIDTAKLALIEARKLVEQLKGVVDESDFPELKDIKIPQIRLPEAKKYKHDLITYKESNVDWVKLSAGLAKYKDIMSGLYHVDVSKDESFQKLYNGFYRIRQRSSEFCNAMYTYLEEYKNSQVSFESTIRYFFEEFGKVEASFSSKVVATIHPNLPVWDSVVLKHLGLRMPGYHLTPDERVLKSIDMYSHIYKFYFDFLKHKLCHKMKSDFDKRFPNNNISDIKKIDLILWQSR